MTVIDIKVGEEEKTLYIDGKLYRDIEEKIKPKIHKKDNDWVWIVDGPEGSGKSVLAQQLAKTIDPSFCNDRMCMTPREFTKAIVRAEKGQCVVFDEAFTGLSSRASLTEINKLIVSLMMEMRQKNLFVIIVMPTFFLLDRYVALFRARGLFHVYLKNGKRGRWVYFNSKKKKLLYLKGKKLFSYSEPRSGFRGRFNDNYTVDEAEYRKKKKEALHDKSRSTRAESYKAQRDIVCTVAYEKWGITQRQMSKDFAGYGWKIKQNTLSEIISEMSKRVLKKRLLNNE
jgi:hypothetical protein